MPEEQEYLTQEKYNEFSEELHQLKSVRRKEVAEQLEYAKSLGDLSENAEYHEARDMQANIEDRIGRLEDLLKRAVIVSDHDTETVTVGSAVNVQKDGQGEKALYTIVGSEESDMDNSKISVKSPFGQAIIGKKKGEIFSFSTPAGKASYKILSIK